MIKQPTPSVAIGLGNGNDLFIAEDDRLYLGISHSGFRADVQLTRKEATKQDIDFLIECLQRLRVHAKP